MIKRMYLHKYSFTIITVFIKSRQGRRKYSRFMTLIYPYLPLRLSMYNNTNDIKLKRLIFFEKVV